MFLVINKCFEFCLKMLLDFECNVCIIFDAEGC